MTNIYDLSKEELEQYFKTIGEPSYRAGQVFGALHNGIEVADIPNIPKSLRERIAEDFYARLPSVIKELKSKDGTKKYLLDIDGQGTLIECVFLTQDYGNTVCVSSQVGCKMACAFCASGKDGFVRNLSAGEILSQVLLLNKLALNIAAVKTNSTNNSGERLNSGGNASARAVSNIVIMGSGEPLDNFDNTMKFLNLVTYKDGINISARNISLSTAGIVPRIKEFADLKTQVNLCISLHAPNDEIRKKIMPVAKTYPIADLVAAAKYFFDKTHRRVIFEYSLIDGVNCEPEHAVELAKLLRGFPVHVNLINLNQTPGSALQPPARQDAMKFMDAIIKAGVSCTMRKSRGDDIAGACGQLKLQNSRKFYTIGGGPDEN